MAAQEGGINSHHFELPYCISNRERERETEAKSVQQYHLIPDATCSVIKYQMGVFDNLMLPHETCLQLRPSTAVKSFLARDPIPEYNHTGLAIMMCGTWKSWANEEIIEPWLAIIWGHNNHLVWNT